MIDLNATGAGLDGYTLLTAQLESLLADERDFIANASQFSAFLFHQLDDLNWAGFYLNRNEELVLGPFQGKPACTRIKYGNGVCGTAVSKAVTMVVENVHEFEGHIACDGASNSEIVVPLYKNGKIIGVLDVDSPEFSRFGNEEKEFFEKIVKILGEKIQ